MKVFARSGSVHICVLPHNWAVRKARAVDWSPAETNYSGYFSKEMTSCATGRVAGRRFSGKQKLGRKLAARKILYIFKKTGWFHIGLIVIVRDGCQ
jgi:hypothetical protein